MAKKLMCNSSVQDFILELNYWLFMYHEYDGHESQWLDGLSEIGMANEHNIAYGKINYD